MEKEKAAGFTMMANTGVSPALLQTSKGKKKEKVVCKQAAQRKGGRVCSEEGRGKDISQHQQTIIRRDIFRQPPPSERRDQYEAVSEGERIRCVQRAN